MGIPDRLQEERKRLDLTQTEMAEAVSSTKRSVINWETGASSPSAEVLGRFAAAGADVLYILTGQRSQPVPAQALLEPRQRALLDHWEHTSEEGKKIIEAAAFAAAQPAAKRGSKAA